MTNRAPGHTRRAALAAALVLLLVSSDAAFGILRNRAPSGASPSDATTYDRAAEAAEDGRCRDALPLLDGLLAESPDDADAHALVGYCRRKTGDVDEAFASYRRALELRPEFPEARQYLGEAHLQAAMREVAILRGYGESGREALEALVDAIRAAAAEAEDAGIPASVRRRAW